MSFIKQLMDIQINTTTTITTEQAFDINYTFDEDELCGTLTFGLPYDNVVSADGSIVNYKNLQRYAKVWGYAKMFDSSPGIVETKDLTKYFTGYINKITLTKTKEAYTYTIECFGTLGMANERSVAEWNETVSGISAINLLFERAGLNDEFPPSSIINGLVVDGQQMVINWSGEKLLKDILIKLKEDYGIKVHQQGDGKVRVWDPIIYVNPTEDSKKTVWSFTLGDNIFKIDYGDLTRSINMVTVIFGTGLVNNPHNTATAVDFTNLQLKAASAGKNTTIFDRSLYSNKIVYRRDLTDPSEAYRVAANTLLDYSKSQVIEIKVPFNAEYKITDFILLNDGERYQNTFMQIWHVASSISKDGDVSTTLKCSSSVLGTQPVKFVENYQGITDIRPLQDSGLITSADLQDKTWEGGIIIT